MHRSELDLIVAHRETMAPEVFIRRMLTTPIYFDRFEDLITMHTSAEEEVSPRSRNKSSLVDCSSHLLPCARAWTVRRGVVFRGGESYVSAASVAECGS